MTAPYTHALLYWLLSESSALQTLRNINSRTFSLSQHFTQNLPGR